MNKLEQLLETTFTDEQIETYNKIKKYNHLLDLKDTLDEILNYDEITQEQYDKAVEDCEIIINRYDDYLYYDWKEVMIDAVWYCIDYNKHVKDVLGDTLRNIEEN